MKERCFYGSSEIESIYNFEYVGKNLASEPTIMRVSTMKDKLKRYYAVIN